MQDLKIQGILFDLDGTLLDTGPDLIAALNAVITARGLAPVAYSPLLNQVAAQGIRGLLQMGLNMNETHPEYLHCVQTFINHYSLSLTQQTDFFKGMPEILQHLDRKKIPWGIVTNKPARFTEVLMQHFGLHQRTRCVLSGDTLPVKKPHPQPLQMAAAYLGVHPLHCLFVGDSEIDMQACYNAKMPGIVAKYGYIAEQEQPEKWGAVGLIDQPLELLDLL